MGDSHDLVTVAILVSRVEALCLADMLNAEGIHVHIGAYHHATVQVIPVALGGYRLMVPAVHHGHASELIREVGADENWSFNQGARRAGIRVLALYVGLHASFAGLGIVMGSLPLLALPVSLLSGLQVPLSPQGRGDYYLSASDTV